MHYPQIIGIASILWLHAIPAAVASTPQPSLNLIYEAPGTAAEIAKRAQVCIAKHLRNEPVELNDSTTQSMLQQPGFRTASTAAGGPVLSFADVDGGVLVATHRVPFSVYGSAAMAQAVLTVSTKDGRFKMETSDIKGAQLNTGAIANAGFVDYRESGKGFKNAVAALEKVQETLVSCIQNNAGDDW